MANREDDSGSSTPHKRRLNPTSLCPSAGWYTHVVAAQGGETIYLAGQVALDGEGKIVGAGDLAAQSRQAFGNLRTALEAAGAAPADVVKLTLYVVNYLPSDLPALRAGMDLCFGAERGFACTLVGVAALAREGLLLEVDAIAVRD